MEHHFNKKRFFFQKFFFVLIIVAAVSLIVFLLWNWLMPAIFNLPEINYLQAVGILILSKILFLGIGKHDHRNHFKDRDYWKKKFENHANLSSERKESDNV
jgi:magnesium-transporting ATPase (P-type)